MPSLRGANDGALLLLELAGEDLHEGGFARRRFGPVRAVAAPLDEGNGDILKEELLAVAHGDVRDGDHIVAILWAAERSRDHAQRPANRSPMVLKVGGKTGFSLPPVYMQAIKILLWSGAAGFCCGAEGLQTVFDSGARRPTKLIVTPARGPYTGSASRGSDSTNTDDEGRDDEPTAVLRRTLWVRRWG